MKYLILLFCIISATAYAQKSEPLYGETFTKNCAQPLSDKTIFILRVEDKTLLLKQGMNDSTNSLSKIKPSWIASIEILKGSTAVEAFGESATNGAIITHLKKGKFRKLTKAFRDQFIESASLINN